MISTIKNKGGSVYFSENKQCWMFSYRLNRQRKRSEYPVFIFGYEEAERRARKQQREYHSNLINTRVTEFLDDHNAFKSLIDADARERAHEKQLMNRITEFLEAHNKTKQ